MSSFANQLLIAMPQMADPAFYRTVTYVVEHTDDGAMGLIINQPLSMSLAQLFDDLNITPRVNIDAAHAVVCGGPVQTDTGFVLHPATERAWNASLMLPDGLSMTTSKDVLEAIATGTGPARALIALGYAGWDAGQLEAEVAENAWLTTPATESLLFEVPFADRWQAAARQLGIDVHLLSTQAGHA
ncbi:YqgE/AlgH family protein [Alcanivorax sp. JB21]|uniref:YqgE/AlgH family protein n=1 Tax=Alcanivorax limicola TaxID=2874102 RepID=UPI001CBA8157|nr:YqgE/AlgH family protein [Alcanivorax limicola]MBZ2188894.1 YqgE/AlgH family protein [Alcanivorax limicola]